MELKFFFEDVFHYYYQELFLAVPFSLLCLPRRTKGFPLLSGLGELFPEEDNRFPEERRRLPAILFS